MRHVLKAVPEPQAILRAWMPFKKLLGVTSVRTEEDYAQARATIDALLDEVGDNESHPLADVLDYLADQVKAYEDENVQIPEAKPSEVLRFLMTACATSLSAPAVSGSPGCQPRASPPSPIFSTSGCTPPGGIPICSTATMFATA